MLCVNDQLAQQEHHAENRGVPAAHSRLCQSRRCYNVLFHSSRRTHLSNFSTLKRVVKGHGSCCPQRASIHTKPEEVKCKCTGVYAGRFFDDGRTNMNEQATKCVTMAQAVIAFLNNQYVERDGREQPFFAGCFGIFGHGNIAGIGQALQQMPEFRYYQARNEQAMVHIAAAYAKTRNRLQTFACTSSIGPGATNMVTGAALATINRLPVLLLPGDIFARRNVAPVLQQLESEHTQDISVNDCSRPVSRYWDRITRPEQLLTALPEAMRVLTSPAETGAVTLALPQDVQAEAHDYPAALFEPRVWTIARPRADRDRLQAAARLLRASRRPLVVAGGGVIYSEATDALRRFADATGIAVGET